jgi:sterol desaturase/sphingolipid hydroxylase (fatty acid hydroxylase superfamily)
MAQLVQTALIDGLRGYARIAWVLPALVALELVFPRERVAWASRLRGLTFWSLTIPFAALVTAGFGQLREALGVRPLFDLRVAGLLPSWAAVVVAPYLASLLNGFFIYWYHRAQHVFLWRFHGVHHAIEELNAVNCADHFTEELWMTLLKSAPMGFLLGLHNETTWWIAAVLSMQGFYLHATTRLHFGPLRYLLNDNRWHRIHHSIEPEHWNQNFGIFSPLWDVVFGTAYFPKADEWPATGAPEAPETVELLDWLLRPLRWKRRVERADHRPTGGAVHAHTDADLVG